MELQTIEKEKATDVYTVLPAVFVYSGVCRQGTLGMETSLNDVTGEKLYVGDIVMTSTIDEFGICSNNGLTVVVSDEFRSVNNGKETEYIPKEGQIEYFVMGIKNVDFMNADSEKWIVKKLKSFKDVVNGEKWTDFGFNYKAD